MHTHLTMDPGLLSTIRRRYASVSSNDIEVELPVDPRQAVSDLEVLIANVQTTTELPDGAMDLDDEIASSLTVAGARSYVAYARRVLALHGQQAAVELLDMLEDLLLEGVERRLAAGE